MSININFDNIREVKVIESGGVPITFKGRSGLFKLYNMLHDHFETDDIEIGDKNHFNINKPLNEYDDEEFEVENPVSNRRSNGTKRAQIQEPPVVETTYNKQLQMPSRVMNLNYSVHSFDAEKMKQEAMSRGMVF
jgi:hypothetical protein